ncbi:MAG: sulfotransferase domain-containing protein [Candidatus Eremiobacteraeota bacterium]|nr:sulfotransferase domain-containing protein [Candidatus Eremiobacteraeota bacterium]
MSPHLNFLLLGAPKCGSTSLHRYLCQHPSIFMAEPKETHYFYRDYEPELNGFSEKYLSGWTGQPVVGEASAKNFVLPFVARRIHEALPQAKLLAILREPVERAYSDWWMHRTSGLEKHCFEDAVERGMNSPLLDSWRGEEGYAKWLEFDRKRGLDGPASPYLERGYYASHLTNFLEHFPRDQILVLFSQELLREPQSVMEKVWRFLGVEDHLVSLEQDGQRAVGSKLARTRKILDSLGLLQMVPQRVRDQAGKLSAKLGDRRPEMKKTTNQSLQLHFQPHNEKLRALIGTLPW